MTRDRQMERQTDRQTDMRSIQHDHWGRVPKPTFHSTVEHEIVSVHSHNCVY